MILDKK